MHVFQSLAVLLHTFCCLSTESTLPGKFFGFFLPQPMMAQLTRGLLLLIYSFYVGYYVSLFYNAVGPHNFPGLFITQGQYTFCSTTTQPSELYCSIRPPDLHTLYCPCVSHLSLLTSVYNNIRKIL